MLDQTGIDKTETAVKKKTAKCNRINMDRAENSSSRGEKQNG